MSACKTLFCASLSSFKCIPHPSQRTVSLSLSSLLHHHPHAVLSFTSKCYTSAPSVTSMEEEPLEEQPNDTVQHILTGNNEGVSRLMKMERREFGESEPQARWFPYLDRFRCGNGYLMSSGEIVDAVSPCISEARKERFGNVVRNRSYSVCLVVEGLCDFGNVSAAFRSADALGVQSVHVVSCDANKRGISDEALELSDLHCSIPMKGMVDSFNVSVAAGILMHHAVCDRISRMGHHGDLTAEERQILLAEFSLRHSNSAISIVQDYAKRKAAILT